MGSGMPPLNPFPNSLEPPVRLRLSPDNLPNYAKKFIQDRYNFFLQLLLALAVWAVFWPALRGSFLHWDDGFNITEQPYLGLGWKNIIWMFTDTSYAPRY